MEVIIEEPIVEITEADDLAFQENVDTLGIVLENMVDEISFYEKVKAEDGMDDTTSEFVYKQIQDRNENYGMDEPNFSIEAFKQTPLKYAKESISDFLKSIWEKIKEIFGKILDYLTGKWNSAAASNNADGRVKALKKREQKIKEAQTKLKESNLSPEAKKDIAESLRGRKEDIDPTIFNGYSAHPVTEKQLDYLIALYKELYHRVNSLFGAVVGDLDFVQARASGLIKGEELFNGPPHWKTTGFIQENFEYGKPPSASTNKDATDKDTRSIRIQKDLLEGTVAIFFKDLNPNSLYVGKLYILDKEDGVKTPTIEEISIDGSLRLINASVDLAKSVEKFASVLTQSIKKCKSSIAHTQNVFNEVHNKSVDDMVEVRTALTALKDIQNLMGFVGTFANRLENHTGKLVTVIAKYPVKI